MAKEVVTGDYVGDPYPSNKFGANPLMEGGLLRKCINYIQFLLFISSFGNSPTGQTGQQIFVLNGSNDANSRKDVPFLGFVDTLLLPM